jgi:hypothetical protein
LLTDAEWLPELIELAIETRLPAHAGEPTEPCQQIRGSANQAQTPRGLWTADTQQRSTYAKRHCLLAVWTAGMSGCGLGGWWGPGAVLDRSPGPVGAGRARTAPVARPLPPYPGTQIDQ